MAGRRKRVTIKPGSIGGTGDPYECLFCRAGYHDACDIAGMQFCECYRNDHEESFV